MDDNVYEVVGDIDIPDPHKLGPIVYVVLCGGCLYYYKNEYGSKAAGAFSLYGYNEVKRAGDVYNEESPSSAWEFKISHIHPEVKTYFFRASSQQEMKIWMNKIKQQMQLANKRNLPTLPEREPGDIGNYEQCGDSGGSFSQIEEKVYETSATLRLQVPKDYSVKRQSEASDDEDEISDRPPLPLPRNAVSPTASDHVKKEIIDEPVNDVEDDVDAVEYWQSIYFDGDRDEARRLLESIKEDGVYLVRNGEQGGKVLQFYASHQIRKFRINEKNGKYSLPVAGEKVTFETIEELVHHYCYEPLIIDGKGSFLTRPYLWHSPS